MEKTQKRWREKLALLTALSSLLTFSLSSCGKKTTWKDLSSTEGWSTAHWIWNESLRENQWVDFRRDFSLTSKPATCLVKIACDSKYYFYVNGQQVIYDGGIRRANTTYVYYDSFDIADYLVTGENSICILAWYQGGVIEANNNNFNKHSLPSGQGGLLFYSPLEDSKNENKTITSGDGQWYVREDLSYRQRIQSENIYLAETYVRYNQHDDDGWKKRDYKVLSGKNWKQATLVGASESDIGCPGDNPWGELRERPIPMMKDYGLTKIEKEDCTITKDGSSTIYTYTLPYNMQITPYLELGSSTKAGGKIEIYTETYNLSKLKTTYITAKGSQSYESPLWINGDYLSFEVSEDVDVVSFGYRQSGYAIENGEDSPFLGKFDSVIKEDDTTKETFKGGWSYSESETSLDNNFYDELYQKSLYTLYVSMRDSYLDCPDRERGQYIGDVVNEMEEGFYALGTETNALSLKAIKEICESQISYTYEGKEHYAMSCVTPSMSLHEIQVQELSTAIGAWNYYLFTGDQEVGSCYCALYNYLMNFDYETSGDYEGTIRMRTRKELYQSYHQLADATSLAEWTDWGNNQDKRIAINCWWYQSAKCVLQLASLENANASNDEIAWLEENLAKVKENFEKFYNEDLKAYATPFSLTDSNWYNPKEMSDNSHLVDDRVNALAVVFGLVDETKYEEIKNVFVGTDSKPAYENASIYMEKYVLEALYKMGYSQEAMSRMAKRQMLDVNNNSSSTLPEYFSTENEVNGGTKNHGWSASAITIFSRYVAGISPVDPGYSSWQVLPQIGSLSSFSISVPSQIGTIEMSLESIDGKTNMTIVSPGGNATIYVPVSTGGTLKDVNGDVNYQGRQTIYNFQYEVYTISTAGTYQFSE